MPQSTHPQETSPLQPTKKLNTAINDDHAEKATRRKSAHFGDLNTNNQPSRLSPGQPQQRKVSALAAQAQMQAQNKRAKRVSQVAPPAPVVSMEVMNNNFEEWMKLATDNKITVTNTWNFALIDYFADLTLLRNGPDDQSINFQKASCTLDGCVKIWTSRVDSVATETGKLLSGLAGGGDDDRDEEVEGEEGEDAENRPARKSHRSEATLAKSFAPLQLKKFDLEFTVDPLFKKTCADFDEGGAMGLLMNHLGVDGRGRVVFDAGDAVVDEEEDQPEEEDLVELSKLRELIPSLEKALTLNISDTLAEFRFSSDPTNMPDFSSLINSFSDDSPPEPEMTYDYQPGDEQDFFGDDDLGGGGGPDDFDSGSVDEDGFGGGLPMAAPNDGAHGPFDPRRQGQGELVMAPMMGEDAEGMFDYFDRGFGKAWAGVEHWKLRKVARKDPTATATKTTRVAKTPFVIDFTSPSTVTAKTLFASAPKSTISLPSTSRARGRASSVGVGRAKKSGSMSVDTSKKRKEEWLLPDDMHFSSRQLLRLFLKPKFSLRMKRSSAQITENANGEIDENFWAQAAAERNPGEEEGGDDAQPIPFESQFFHDDMGGGDDDDNDFVDDILDGDGGGANSMPEEEDLWAGTQGQELKRARPENVNFAKKAKRVDVKRLKDDIWVGLKSLVPVPKDNDSEEDTDLPQTPVEEGEGKTFDSIIQNLRQTYPSDKMSEISTSFCFICLLHLANEEGLRIETARFGDDGDGENGFCGLVEDGEGEGREKEKEKESRRRKDKGEKSDRIVGELQALKVYKDPNAGRAA